MKHLYFGLLFILFPVVLQAQEGDIEQEIKNYSESRSQLISKGRRLLTDTFLEGNIAKVKEIKDYLLTELQNEDYVALYPGEEWLIMYWMGEYDRLQESVLYFNMDSVNKYQRRISPGPDMLYQKLLEKSYDELVMLEDKINNSALGLPTKDFLLLHLNFMLSGDPLMKITQEEINAMADLYLETHPNSTYEYYVKNNIRYKLAPSKWGFAFDFFTGFGMFTGELLGMYNNQGVFGISFDVEYQKFTLYLRNYIGFNKTKQDREAEGVLWQKGSESQTFLPEASIGYAVLENDKIKLSPFAGIGAASISPTTVDVEERPELEVLEVGFSPAYTVGLNLNIKLGWDVAPLLSHGDDKSYWFIKLRYGYTMPQFNEPLHNGNIHQFTIGFGGMYRGMRRVL